MYARNQWYAAAVAAELTDQLLARTILDEPILMYRTTDGQVAALEDRCSHRNVPLSLGKRIGDRVQCPYHGLEFGAGGACLRIPGLSAQPAAGYAIRAYPVVERDGYVWLWPGEAPADESLIPDYGWHSREGWTGTVWMRTIRAGYIFNLENLLDLSHIAYVHTATISTDGFEQAEVRTVVGDGFVEVHRAQLDVDSDDRLRGVSGGRRVDRRSVSRYIAPSNFMLHSVTSAAGVADDPAAFKNRFGGPSTPETASSHHHFMSAYRNYALEDPALTQHMVDRVNAAFAEDEVLLVRQQERVDNGTYKPVKLFHVDKGAAAGVRMLQAMIDAERMQVAAE